MPGPDGASRSPQCDHQRTRSGRSTVSSTRVFPNGEGAADGRALIYIPVLHTEADMGGLAPSLRRVAARKLGRGARARAVDVIARIWATVRETVEGWELRWEKVRLYQDGLPRCGREMEIVTALAGAGSPNHQLLLSLVSRGATLMGTEAPDLLVEEYRLAQQLLLAEQAASGREARQTRRSRLLLVRRDQYIAKRISESLRPGEIGLLFVGMLHTVEPYLAKDIHVSHPIRSLPRPGRGKA